MLKDEETSVPPEEEELFREFEAYVRSIYTAATSGAVQKLEASTDELRNEIGELWASLSQSYTAATSEAVEKLEASTDELRNEIGQLWASLSESYTAATSGAVEKLEASTDELSNEIGELKTTVTESREAYADLFAPAIARMEKSVKTILEKELAQVSAQIRAVAEIRESLSCLSVATVFCLLGIIALLIIVLRR